MKNYQIEVKIYEILLKTDWLPKNNKALLSASKALGHKGKKINTKQLIDTLSWFFCMVSELTIEYCPSDIPPLLRDINSLFCGKTIRFEGEITNV